MNEQTKPSSNDGNMQNPKVDEPGIYLPTLEQIAAECARIRSGQGPTEVRKRRRIRPPDRSTDDLR